MAAVFDLNRDGKVDGSELMIMEERYREWLRKKEEKDDFPDIYYD